MLRTFFIDVVLPECALQHKARVLAYLALLQEVLPPPVSFWRESRQHLRKVIVCDVAAAVLVDVSA